jgi:uncharacterized protein YqkB
MFGAGAIIKTPSTVRRTPKKNTGNDSSTKPVQVQKSMSSFLLDKMIIGDINKKKKATAAKKIKEQSEQQQQ